MKQRTAEVLIVIAFILLSLWLMGGNGGRGQDYYEYQTDNGYADSELP